jgi:hypothetical protein
MVEEYILNLALGKCTKELLNDISKGIYSIKEREIKGEFYKLKYVGVRDVELWEKKDIGWFYLCNIIID